jgi:hypothetical protein
MFCPSLLRHTRYGRGEVADVPGRAFGEPNVIKITRHNSIRVES